MMRMNQQKNAVLEGIVRYAYEKENKVVVYDDFSGFPLMVTFLGSRWWVTTPGEMLQPLDEWLEGEDISFCFLCEAGGKVGALALAKLLGKAAEEPEDGLEKVLRSRVNSLKRLGVALNVKDEPLILDLRTFSNEGTYRSKGKYTAMCYAINSNYDSLFDIADFDSKKDAEEWARCYFDFLKYLGIELKVIRRND